MWFRGVSVSWNTIELQKAVSILSGFAFKSELFNDEGNGIPIIRIRDVVRGYSDTFYTGPYDEKYIIRDGDFLIGMDGEFNIAAWKSGDALLNQRVCKVDWMDESLVDRRFLAYFMRQELKKIEDLTPFVTVKHLSVKTLNAIEIPLPPLAEQQRIAAVLDKADALRAKRRHALARLDALLQSTFLHLFGDPVTNPMGFGKRKLKDITLNITDGKHGDCRPLPDSGYYFVSVKDIRDGRIDFSNARQIHPDDFMEVHRRTRLETGDVLITNSGTIGKTAVVDTNPLIERTTFQKSVAIVKPNHDQLDSFYLKTIFDLSVQELMRSSSGSSQKNLLLGQLRDFEINLPSLDQQHIFASQVKTIERLRATHTTAIETLDNLFHALQQRAFKGEL